MKISVVEKLALDLARTAKLMTNEKYIIYDGDILSRLDEIADVNIMLYTNRTLLMCAVMYERQPVVAYLLSRNNNVNHKDKNGFTALHFAVQTGNYCIIEMLLNAGALINEKNIYGNSPLMLCDNKTDITIFEMLIKNGADPLQKNNYGVCALDMFASSPEIQCVLKQ